MESKTKNSNFQSLADVRTEIDSIDREIVGLIGRRSRCVQEAARFKKMKLL